MRYMIKQKFWSLREDFTIRDEQGNDQYFVDGQAFSIGKKLSFRNLQGEELAYICEKLLAWGPTYEIHRPGCAVTVLKKEHFTFFHCDFVVDGPGDDDFEVKGNFMENEYEIMGKAGPAAHVSKQWFSPTDTYGIEIDEGDTVLLLATAVVIDLICHDGEFH
ncbi:MAG: LURP-one-related family protein [Gloeobacteraceae cyanobacterium ES-bin-144]|nr:LURP-one-related family protein [Verrucomicrobiales bacterium]